MISKNFSEKIEIPSDNQLELDGMKITIKGKNGEVIKQFKMPRFVFTKEGNSLLITCKNYKFSDKTNFFSIKSHIKNMVQGANEQFMYMLKICSSHFPMNVSLSGDKFVVKNLFGEKVPRVLIIKKGAKVEIKGNIVEVTGNNLEIVSQVAADIEQLTRITGRDRRIFQDGIYITHKAGKLI
jgi:large subunit ribosomal protein L6